MSMPPRWNSSSIVRATSIGTAAPARVRPGSGGSASPPASTRGGPAADTNTAACARERRRRPVVGQELARVDAPPALAYEVLRARRRDDQDPVPTSGELVADAA